MYRSHKTGSESPEPPRPRTSESAKSDHSMLEHPHPTGPGGVFDGHVHRMLENVDAFLLEDKAPIGAHRVVPADYQMTNYRTHHQVERYLQALEEAQHRHRNGIQMETGQKPEQKRFGFHPEELKTKNVLYLPTDFPYRYNTLTNDISPLLHYERFYELPTEVYDVISPALRLASVFLTHPAASRYWHTMAFGVREDDTSILGSSGQPSKRIREDVPWTAEGADSFARYLFRIHKHHRIGFDVIGGPTNILGMCWLTPENARRRRLPLDHGNHPHLRTVIYLHPDFYTTAVKIANSCDPDPNMVLRFNLLLAVLICHELAHSLEAAPNFPNPEVILNDHTWAECGAAWETKMFGGRIWPISERMDCADGLMIGNYPIRDLDDESPNIYHSIPMQYIATLQQQGFWEQNFDISNPNLFQIPLDGVRSFGLNAPNTRVWTEEELMRSSEMVIDDDGGDADRGPEAWRLKWRTMSVKVNIMLTAQVIVIGETTR